MSYALKIITPKGIVFDDQVDSLNAPGSEGSFGILSNHAPFVSLLKKGLIEVKQGTNQKYFVINSGILEVKEDGEVLVLPDQAIVVESKEAAKQELVKNL